MNEVWRAVLVFIFGAGGLAVINIVQERWKMRYERKTKKEDKTDECKETLEKISKQLDEFIDTQTDYNNQAKALFEEMEVSDATQNEAMKYVLLDRVLYIGQSYIKKGEVTFDDRKRLRDMYEVYHDRLGGNGDAKHIMEAVDALPLKQ